ncbi:MAG: hypothetical protein LBF22_10090, partial [Deltaproteobacteria bacterium]|nr:hypothetical protein [Deltaproteobacteria bacterium]
MPKYLKIIFLGLILSFFFPVLAKAEDERHEKRANPHHQPERMKPNKNLEDSNLQGNLGFRYSSRSGLSVDLHLGFGNNRIPSWADRHRRDIGRGYNRDHYRRRYYRNIQGGPLYDYHLWREKNRLEQNFPLGDGSAEDGRFYFHRDDPLKWPEISFRFS